MLELVAFVAGASIMAIEIVASRILAPFLGNSIVVWTSLIGVIMAALSYGYWRGGLLADRNPSLQKLSGILALAGLLVVVIAAGRNVCLTAVSRLESAHVASIVAEILLFAPVSFVLAMVSPYVVRLKMKEMGSSGETVGKLYAISTIGSIFGTFVAGFYLLAVIGSTGILICIAAILFVTSFLTSATGYRKARGTAAAAAIICALVTPKTSVPFIGGVHVFESDSHYNHYLVYDMDGASHPTHRPVRSLVLDRAARQSAIYLDRQDDFALEYLRYFRLATHFRPDAKRVLLMGGGAFIYPMGFLKENPTKSLDVVELDPALEGIAGKYFGFAPNPRLNLYFDDARVYLNRCQKIYDVAYLDVFGSNATVPYYLTTRETAQRMYDILAPDGIAVLNVSSAIDGPQGRFFRGELATYRSVFPRVEVFRPSGTGDRMLNIIMVAFKDRREPVWSSEDPRIQGYLSHRWTKPVDDDTAVLTDNFAPAEIYIVGWFDWLSFKGAIRGIRSLFS